MLIISGHIVFKWELSEVVIAVILKITNASVRTKNSNEKIVANKIHLIKWPVDLYKIHFGCGNDNKNRMFFKQFSVKLDNKF